MTSTETKATHFSQLPEIERRITNKVIDALIGAGYGISVYDGEEMVLRNSRSRREIRKFLASTDSDCLYAIGKEGRGIGWAALIWGNGEDVLSDYTVNLDTILDPIIDAL